MFSALMIDFLPQIDKCLCLVVFTYDEQSISLHVTEIIYLFQSAEKMSLRKILTGMKQEEMSKDKYMQIIAGSRGCARRTPPPHPYGT